ncbi:hypothetical protein THASP1DRAFT_28129 [Thamnocephalis sphaerospora]|uniref:START domain-containing protein n=1 Tax=Thamnocephalis sphaerospora TaxID=78915 RepID=A0A4P9XV11_9FUNG|nr:hypothetical protein THASP1DRAFT_28129 [Thamnocephalis sphaerospora]|eukprot:RKP10083.1 hypothetical protein THASP1DRAFT_28129 [Thamnocephalis sphaerospora]
MPFTAQDFKEAVVEFRRSVEDELAAGWEQVSTLGDLVVYRRPLGEKGGYEYMARGELVDIKPEVCHDVFVDLDYRRRWDNYKKSALHVIGEDVTEDGDTASGEALKAQLSEATNDRQNAIYWRQDYTWPVQSRDYCLERESQRAEVERETTWIVLTASVDPSLAKPEQEGCIRVNDCRQKVVLQASPSTPFSTAVYFYYHEDPRGSLPSTVFDWALKHGVPSWLKRFTKACAEYHTNSFNGNMLDGVSELKEVLDESLKKGFVL